MSQKLWWQEFTDVVFVHRIYRNRYTGLSFRHIVSTTSTEELEAVEFQAFTKSTLLNQLIDSRSFEFLVNFLWNKSWHTHAGNVNRSAIADKADCFLWVRWVFLSVRFWSECSVASCHWMLYWFITYCILFSNLHCIGYHV